MRVKVVMDRAISGTMASDVTEAYGYLVRRTLNRLDNDLNRHFEDQADPDAVHDVRVDIRILTSILYLFSPIMIEADVASADKVLKSAIGVFGDKRELDMLVKSLKDFADYDPIHRESASHVVTSLKSLSVHERALNRELIKNEVKVAGDRLLSLELREKQDFKAYAGKRLSGMLLELREGAAGRYDKKRRIHRYRIACKKALYSLELAEEKTDLGFAVWRARLKAVQDVAGSIHDAEVNSKLFRGLGIEDKEFSDAFLGFLEERIADGRKAFMTLMKEIKGMETMIG